MVVRTISATFAAKGSAIDPDVLKWDTLDRINSTRVCEGSYVAREDIFGIGLTSILRLRGETALDTRFTFDLGPFDIFDA